MADEEQVLTDTEEQSQQEGEAEANDSQDESTDGELSPEQIADLKKKATAFEDQKRRAEKAEAQLKKLQPEKKSDEQAPSQQETLSQKDMFALIKADVHEDDIQEVTDYAKLKGISVSEALKAPVMKTILSEKAEERSTARATNVQGGARGSSKVSTERLIADAKKGIMPDNDADMQRLIEAELEQKRSRK